MNNLAAKDYTVLMLIYMYSTCSIQSVHYYKLLHWSPKRYNQISTYRSTFYFYIKFYCLAIFSDEKIYIFWWKNILLYRLNRSRTKRICKFSSKSCVLYPLQISDSLSLSIYVYRQHWILKIGKYSWVSTVASYLKPS